MTSHVSSFYTSIEGVANFSDVGHVDFFVYYLTVVDTNAAASVTAVGECFKACDLTPPSRIAPYLSEGLKSKPQKFVKVEGGYKLQRHYREVLERQYGLVGEKAPLRNGSALTFDESVLVDAMTVVVPSAGLSYRQAVIDLRDEARASFRGPALELREALREIVDHKAPDKEVIRCAGFILESGRSGPTLKQKVRFILRARGTGKTKAGSAEDSAVAIDTILGDLARSVYDLGSLSAHVASERRQVAQLKRYIDAVLHDILEVD